MVDAWCWLHQLQAAQASWVHEKNCQKNEFWAIIIERVPQAPSLSISHPTIP